MNEFEQPTDATAFAGGRAGTPLRRRAGGVLLVWLGMLAPAFAASPFQLRDVTQKTGITFKHTDGSSGKRYIVETLTAGLALFDYDRDGDIDIYFLNGAPLRGTRTTARPRNALYRNDGGWKFTDVTDRAGIGDAGFGLGKTDRIDRLEVRWIGGGVDVFKSVPVDQLLTLVEGGTIGAKKRLPPAAGARSPRPSQ